MWSRICRTVEEGRPVISTDGNGACSNVTEETCGTL
jgi:hypothetical protein